jgi:hypothetical protein
MSVNRKARLPLPVMALAITALTAVVLPAAAAADPPFNDAFEQAEVLSGDRVAASGTNVEATKEAGEPAHGNDAGGASVWFVWTSTVDGPVRIETCGSDFDTLLGVYTGGSVAALTEIVGDDQGCGDQSRVDFTADLGTDYRIAVDGWSDEGAQAPAMGSISLTISAGPPANDDFASPTDLGSEPANVVAGDNVLATKQTGEPDHAGDPGGSSVWFTWTAPFTGGARVSTCGSDFDTTLGVYTGAAVGALTEVASNDDFSCDGASSARFEAVNGTTYRIAVDGFSGAAPREGSIIVDVRPAPLPANDDFANAESLGNTISALASGDTSEASSESGEPSHAGAPPFTSLWYRWQAPSNGPTTITTCAPGAIDSVLAVYTGSALNALTPVVGNDDDPDCFIDAMFSTVQFNATAGTVYRIAVDSVHCCGFGRGDFILELSHTAVSTPPPANQPPETTIVKGPKKKTTKRKTTFEFISSEAGSTFECKLDKGEFAPCSSPHKVKVKKGKHTFQVRAIDAEGAVDPTPAARVWKVKKKRKRR